MSDSDEYEKIEEASTKSSDESEAEKIETDESFAPTVTHQMKKSDGNNQSEEMAIENNVVMEEEEEDEERDAENESNYSYIYCSDEELYESQLFEIVSSPSTEAHEKRVQTTNQKMKELKITTPDIICIEGDSFIIDNTAKNGDVLISASALEELKRARQNFCQSFAETKSLGSLASLIEVNEKLAQMQGFDDIKSLKSLSVSEPKPCSSKTLLQPSENPDFFFDDAAIIIDDMNSFYDYEKTLKSESRCSFRELHESFLKQFLRKTGIENPLIEKKKMKYYGTLLAKMMKQCIQRTEYVSKCPFGKYMNAEIKDDNPVMPSQIPAQDGNPLSQLEAHNIKLEQALTASKAATEEFAALLEERDKAYAEDPKDSQLHEHMAKLCNEAKIRCQQTAKEYANLCSNPISKLTVVQGPTFNIPPKGAEMMWMNSGIDLIKKAEEEESKKNLPEALQLYSEAVDCFLRAIDFELTDPQAKENVRQKIQKYILKHEKLQKFLKKPPSNEVKLNLDLLRLRSTATGSELDVPEPFEISVQPSGEDFYGLEDAVFPMPKPKYRHFNAFNQYQLYLMLNKKFYMPTQIQSEFFEALKNGIYGTYATDMSNVQALEDAVVKRTYTLMKRNQEECADILNEKGLAVLADLNNASLQFDLINSCSEAYEKWKASKVIYEKAVKDHQYELWLVYYNQSPLDDISKNFKCEKVPKKSTPKSDGNPGEEKKPKKLKKKKIEKKKAVIGYKKLKPTAAGAADDANLNNFTEKMVLAESGAPGSSKYSIGHQGYSTPQVFASSDAYQKLEEMRIAEKKRHKDGLTGNATSWKVGCSKDFRIMEDGKEVVGTLTQYRPRYINLGEIGGKFATPTNLSSHPNDAALAYCDLMDAYKKMIYSKQVLTDLNISANDIFEGKNWGKYLEYQSICEEYENAKALYTRLYNEYNKSEDALKRKAQVIEKAKDSKSKTESLNCRIHELEIMSSNCKNFIDSCGKKDDAILKALDGMLKEELSLKRWELALMENVNGQTFQDVYKQNFVESEQALRRKTAEFERLRDKRNSKNNGIPIMESLGSDNAKSDANLRSDKSKIISNPIAEKTCPQQPQPENNAETKYQCRKCKTYLIDECELVTPSSNTKISLKNYFSYFSNIKSGELHEKSMIIGKYFIRDVHCANCQAKLGWIYEFAFDEKNKNVEGKTFFENTSITVVTESQAVNPSPSSESQNVQETLNEMEIDVGREGSDKAISATSAMNNKKTEVEETKKSEESQKTKIASNLNNRYKERNALLLAKLQEINKSKVDDKLLKTAEFPSSDTVSKDEKLPPWVGGWPTPFPTFSNPIKRCYVLPSEMQAIEEELKVVNAILKDTENSRRTLIEINEGLKTKNEDLEEKCKAIDQINDYHESECKQKQKKIEDLQQENDQKDVTIAQLKSQLAQMKDATPKNPFKLVESLGDVKLGDKSEPKDLAGELAKAQQQIEYYRKLVADQAEALKHFELAKALEKQLSEATQKAEKAEKALRKREAMDSVSRDLILKRFKDNDDDEAVI